MTKTKSKVNIITLGCSKNTVDSERLARQLKLNNISVVEDAENADTLIINTCGFIDAAKEESVNTILEAVNEKNKGNVKKVFVAGCLSERYMKDLENDIPEVDKYFGTEAYSSILEQFGGELKYDLLGERDISTPLHYAYLKISEGCDNPCSFCAIPLMRGKHKSRTMDFLLNEAEFLAKKGVKELIIIGQDTTDYGKDIYGKRNIAELLNNLSKIEGIEWIRLLYAYPSHFPDDLIEEIAANKKICKYVDIPLQHISDDVLRSMRRGITKRRTAELLYKLKEKVPGITLRTTFIVGYPNESKEAFNELVDFVNEIEFDRVGVFNFSVEENTPSFILNDPVSAKEKARRRDHLMEIQQNISYKKNEARVGKIEKVIIDRVEGEYYIARSENETPEVDGEMLITAADNDISIGNFYYVEITDNNEYDLYAKLCHSKEEL